MSRKKDVEKFLETVRACVDNDAVTFVKHGEKPEKDKNERFAHRYGIDKNFKYKVIKSLTWDNFEKVDVADDPRFSKSTLYSFVKYLRWEGNDLVLDADDGYEKISTEYKDGGVDRSPSDEELRAIFGGGIDEIEGDFILREAESVFTNSIPDDYCRDHGEDDAENFLGVYVKMCFLLDDEKELIVVSFHEAEY